jgi:hypothetical protein
MVFRALGITPSNELTWSVGTRIATMYAREYGVQPPKDNRPKTNGPGSHCFALYPESWVERIKEIILAEQKAEQSQGDLFGEP